MKRGPPESARVPSGPGLPVFPAGARSLGSGRRVRGREADRFLACEAEGALDAAAATGTLMRRGRPPRLPVSMSDERAWFDQWGPADRRRVAAPLDLIRLNSATDRADPLS